MANGTLKVSNIETSSGSGTITIGQSGETITVPSGATLNLSNATQTGVGGANTPAFEAYLSADQTMSDNAVTKIQFNTEVYDDGSGYDNSSNYRFTVPSGEGGTYKFYTTLNFSDNEDDAPALADAAKYKLNSSLANLITVALPVSIAKPASLAP